jgi:hypothetical protein
MKLAPADVCGFPYGTCSLVQNGTRCYVDVEGGTHHLCDDMPLGWDDGDQVDGVGRGDRCRYNSECENSCPDDHECFCTTAELRPDRYTSSTQDDFGSPRCYEVPVRMLCTDTTPLPTPGPGTPVPDADNLPCDRCAVKPNGDQVDLCRFDEDNDEQFRIIGGTCSADADCQARSSYCGNGFDCFCVEAFDYADWRVGFAGNACVAFRSSNICSWQEPAACTVAPNADSCLVTADGTEYQVCDPGDNKYRSFRGKFCSADSQCATMFPECGDTHACYCQVGSASDDDFNGYTGQCRARPYEDFSCPPTPTPTLEYCLPEDPDGSCIRFMNGEEFELCDSNPMGTQNGGIGCDSDADCTLCPSDYEECYCIKSFGYGVDGSFVITPSPAGAGICFGHKFWQTCEYAEIDRCTVVSGAVSCFTTTDGQSQQVCGDANATETYPNQDCKVDADCTASVCDLAGYACHCLVGDRIGDNEFTERRGRCHYVAEDDICGYVPTAVACYPDGYGCDPDGVGCCSSNFTCQYQYGYDFTCQQCYTSGGCRVGESYNLCPGYVCFESTIYPEGSVPTLTPTPICRSNYTSCQESGTPCCSDQFVCRRTDSVSQARACLPCLAAGQGRYASSEDDCCDGHMFVKDPAWTFGECVVPTPTPTVTNTPTVTRTPTSTKTPTITPTPTRTPVPAACTPTSMNMKGCVETVEGDIIYHNGMNRQSNDFNVCASSNDCKSRTATWDYSCEDTESFNCVCISQWIDQWDRPFDSDRQQCVRIWNDYL